MQQPGTAIRPERRAQDVGDVSWQKTSCLAVAAQVRRLVTVARDVAVRIIVELEIAAIAHLHFPDNSVRRAIPRGLRDDRDFVSRLYSAPVGPAQSRSPEGR